MVGFEEGYKFFADNSPAIYGAEISDSYITSFEEEVEKLVNNLNSFEGYDTSTKIHKGDVAEFWHSGTFNINAIIEGSKHRTCVDRSHVFASPDISSDFEKEIGLKYYNNAQASAKAQSISIFQRFKEYQSAGGKDDFEKFLTDRGYTDIEKIMYDPIYNGQIRIVPRDQLEEAVNWLKLMIETEKARRPEQVYRYQETLDLISDRLKDSEGIESIPLSKSDAEKLASLAKQGEIDTDNIGLSLIELIKLRNIMQQAVDAGITAASISIILEISPLIVESISHLIKEGEIESEQFKKIGFAALSGGSEGFIRGAISSALTICCKKGMLGTLLISTSPNMIAVTTVLAINVIKNSYEVVRGNMTKSELTVQFVRDMYLIACSQIMGSITQSLIDIPVFGFLIGNFVGSIIGAFSFDMCQKAIVSFCVDSGFTMFGLVDQDYTLPKEILEKCGIETFDFDTFEADSFIPEYFEVETFKTDTFEPDTLGITFLRRGVIGVSKIGYLNQY